MGEKSALLLFRVSPRFFHQVFNSGDLVDLPTLPRPSQDLKDLPQNIPIEPKAWALRFELRITQLLITRLPNGPTHYAPSGIAKQQHKSLLAVQQFATGLNHGLRREAELLEQLF